MKQKAGFIIAGSFILITILFFSAVHFEWFQTNNYSDNPLNETKDVILYYGSTCSHCKSVEEYIKENKINVKLSAKDISIVRKEIYENVDNKLEFELITNFCKLKDFEKGVPLIFYNQKCYVGDTDVLSKFDEISGN